MMKFIFLIFLCIFNVHCVTYNENTYFVNTADLSGQNYKVDWNYTSTDIVFRITAKTIGWVGFGLSPNGGMKNSDMILAWTDSNGSPQFRDAHSANSNNVIYDTVQNWERLYYSVSNGVTTVIFKRSIKVCNPNQPASEINIEVAATQYVIFAWSTAFSNNLPTYHSGTRGSKFLPLLSSLNSRIVLDMNKIEIENFAVDTIIKSDRQTDYFCVLHQLPADYATTKRHLVRFDTIFQPSHSKYVHHWVLNECDISFDTEYFVNHTFPAPASCAGRDTTKEWNEVLRYCTKSSLAWATGGDLESYIPENLGYPLGGPGQSKFFFIQWHIENTDRDQNIREDASVKMFFTKNYRETEFGVIEVGAQFNPPALAIPPKAKNLTLEYMCKKSALNAIRGSNKEITIFAQLPHTHNAGVSFYSKIIRNGTEVENVAENKYYDNAFQIINYLPNPVKIREDDELLLSCVYNSEYSDKFVLGGLGTDDEMCLNFLWYYPRSSASAQCFSFLPTESWIGLFDNLNKTGQIDWHFDSEQTFFQDSFKRIEESALMNDPAKMEKIFDDFFKNTGRIVYYDNKAEYDGPIKVQRMTKETCSGTSTTASPSTTTNYFNSSTKNKGIVGFLVLGVLTALFF